MPDTYTGSEPALGARLVVSQRGYRHHGIYAGRGLVIHYAGLITYPRGRIEEVALEDFVGNRPMHVEHVPESLPAEDTVRHARSRLGECRYDLLRNNCEHFCNWCQIGEARSLQIDSLTRPARTLVRTAAAVASWLTASKRRRAASRAVPFNDAVPGDRWRRFLPGASLIKSDAGLAAARASTAESWLRVRASGSPRTTPGESGRA